MFKNLLKKTLNKIGYEIVKVNLKNNEKSRRTKELTYYETKTGNYYLPADAKGDEIARAIISGEIFDKDILEASKGFISENTAVLDVGANFGQMTILLSKFLNNKGKVYSFEADDFIFSILEKNIQANRCKNVETVFGVVSDKNNEMHFYPEQDFERFQTYGSYGPNPNINVGRKVKTLTIDSLGISEKISFMKFDIQGYDLRGMRGAVETIKKNKMPIIFEFEWLFQDDLNLSFQEYVDFVLSIGYRFDRLINAQNYLIVPSKS